MDGSPVDGVPAASLVQVEQEQGPPAEKSSSPVPPRNRIRFATPQEHSQIAEQLSEKRVAVVSVTRPSRGKLWETIESALDDKLRTHGAPGPSLHALQGALTLTDSLYRARQAGLRGICLTFDPLSSITQPLGALGAEDSVTLRRLAEWTQTEPLWLVFHADDESISACADPVPLTTLPEFKRMPDRAMPQRPIMTTTVTTTVTVPAATLRATDRAAPQLASFAAAKAVFEPRATTAVAVAEETAAPKTNTPERNPAPSVEELRSAVVQLVAARGPQPLSALERLFAKQYMPLARAIENGFAEPRALQAYQDFRQGFAKSYGDAFPTLAATGKRPKMVLDAPEIAGRLARMHGARTTQMLLVDGLRWDVGQVMRQHLSTLFGARAILSEELILWSALPTTTSRQLDALARGIDSLRSSGSNENDNELVRGRTAEWIRRVRVGTRDIHKLDLVEAQLRQAESRPPEFLDELAVRAAEAVAKHAETLAQRTLLFVFGDHGFSLDRTGMRQGGASPEEVLVPAFAYLIGEVH